MANITLAIDDDLLKKSRKYAKQHQTTLNKMVRELILKQVETDANWKNGMFKMMDKAKGNSKGKKWTREEIHRV